MNSLMNSLKLRVWMVTAVLFGLAGSLTNAAVMFDESTPGLVLSGGAAPYYDPAFTPATNPNGFYLLGGSASATPGLVAGQKYLVSTRRTVNDTGNLGYDINLGGVDRVHDNALPFTVNDAAEAFNFLGYYQATGSDSVQAHNGGPWNTRLDYLAFTPTSDMYFDENTSGRVLSGGAADGLLPVNTTKYNTSLVNDSGFNGTLLSAGAVAGTISLTAGAVYNVYASREVLSGANGNNLSFDLSLGGASFATVSGSVSDSAMDNTLQEAYLGQFSVGSTFNGAVLLNNGGSYNARVDYIRFEFDHMIPVPEPSVIWLIGLGGGLVWRRRSR